MSNKVLNFFFSLAVNTVQIQLPHKQYLLQNHVAPTYLLNETGPNGKVTIAFEV